MVAARWQTGPSTPVSVSPRARITGSICHPSWGLQCLAALGPTKRGPLRLGGQQHPSPRKVRPCRRVD
eukprot:2453901-Lingulodinium_polyedra.AAC.1